MVHTFTTTRLLPLKAMNWKKSGANRLLKKWSAVFRKGDVLKEVPEENKPTMYESIREILIKLLTLWTQKWANDLVMYIAFHHFTDYCQQTRLSLLRLQHVQRVYESFKKSSSSLHSFTETGQEKTDGTESDRNVYVVQITGQKPFLYKMKYKSS